MCEYMLEVSPKMLRAPVSVWWVSLGGGVWWRHPSLRAEEALGSQASPFGAKHRNQRL